MFQGAIDETTESQDRIIEYYCQFISAFLEECQLERPILLGHSYGGFLCLRFASAHPERVAKLILCDTAGLVPTLGVQV